MQVASLMLLHRPVEVLWLESSCSTSEIDLSHRGSWFDPNIGPSCVLDRLIVGELVLIRFSQDRPRKFEIFSTYHDREAVIILTR